MAGIEKLCFALVLPLLCLHGILNKSPVPSVWNYGPWFQGWEGAGGIISVLTQRREGERS